MTRVKVSDVQELSGAIDDLHDRGVTDGLPVIPPERSRVDADVEAAGLQPDELLGIIPPRFVEVTVRDVAVNAVLAGCRPEYLPVVIAIMRVVLHPDSNPMGVATTTKGVVPLTIVNGPIRERLGFNAQGNLFGPGPRANAAIGRAVRLTMLNLGGASPRILDKSTIGHSGKYSFVIAEDEENSPWEPLHVTHGYRPEDDVVTVMPAEAPTAIITERATRIETVLDTLADSMNVASHYASTGPAECLVILSPEHRAIAQQDGWSKTDVATYLHDVCWRPAGDLWRLERAARGFTEGQDPPSSRVPLFGGPSDILIVAGGGAGAISAFCWGFADHRLFGHSGHRRIDTP